MKLYAGVDLHSNNNYFGIMDKKEKKVYKKKLPIAHLLKLGILPEGYIYPKEERPVSIC